MIASESAAAAVLGKKKKPEALPKEKKPKVDPLLAKAQRWADLHANPKTRSKMDELLTGLTTEDAHRVVLNGQRIAAGLQPKY
jgi:hypothetical protein